VVLSHSHRIRCTCNSCFNHRPVATQLRITELRAMNGKCQPPSPRPRTVTPGDSQSSLVARPTLCITNSFNSIMNSYREYRTSDLQLAVDGIHEWEAKCGPAYMTDEISGGVSSRIVLWRIRGCRCNQVRCAVGLGLPVHWSAVFGSSQIALREK
jgi:hypothetical protein